MEVLLLMLQFVLLLLGCVLSLYLQGVNTTVVSVVYGATLFGVTFYAFILFAGAADLPTWGGVRDWRPGTVMIMYCSRCNLLPPSHSQRLSAVMVDLPYSTFCCPTTLYKSVSCVSYCFICIAFLMLNGCKHVTWATTEARSLGFCHL